MKKTVVIFVVLLSCTVLRAQQYDGMSGLIHLPSAESDEECTARVGTHYICKELMPACKYFTYANPDKTRERYDDFSYYLSITPFKWVEASYTCVLLKRGPQFENFDSKDRHFSVKFYPLKEGKWWPAIAVGGQDFMGSNLEPGEGQDFFGNFYITGVKHFLIGSNELAVHAAYRYYTKDYNKGYQGIVGGITFRPGFAPQTRAIIEWDGLHLNFGIDALLFKHLLLQASLTDGKHFSAGLCGVFNL